MARKAETEARKEREQAAGLVATVVRLPEDLWLDMKYLALARRSSLRDEVEIALRKHLAEAGHEVQRR